MAINLISIRVATVRESKGKTDLFQGQGICINSENFLIIQVREIYFAPRFTKEFPSWRPGLKMGMDFKGQIRKRAWKVTYFGLKYGQGLKNQAAYRTKNSEVPVPRL